MKWNIIQLFFVVKLSLSLVPIEIMFIILSQPDAYHRGLTKILYDNIIEQSASLNSSRNIANNIKILHEIIDHPGYWTILPLLPDLVKRGYIGSNIKWIVICDDQSYVDLKLLISGLNSLDWTENMYIGYPMYDKEATIIHHFAFFEKPQWFPYPLIRSGIALTAPFVKRLAIRVEEGKPTSDFFIDASHELSLFIWQNMRRATTTENNKLKSRTRADVSLRRNHPGGGSRISSGDSAASEDASGGNSGVDYATKTQETHGEGTKLYKARSDGDHKLLMAASPYFCRTKRENCAVYAREPRSTCDRVDIEEVYFAIKTYHKFHGERIPIIEKTWGRYAVHKKYFSDIADDTIPTFATNVANTETGHCAKTLSIFKLALKDIDEMNASTTSKSLQKPIKWIFLCDDDTLLSVSRVCDILGCFNATQYIYLGERYGYRLHSKDGFNYITGGGGMALSLPTARKIVTTCVCPSISSPDDMIIGMCLQRLGIKAIHSPKFHQARPSDYAVDLLSLDEPISFHKFWQIDPIRTYEMWFHSVDRQKRAHATKMKSNEHLCDTKTSQSTNFPRKSTNTDMESRRKTHHHIDL